MLFSHITTLHRRYRHLARYREIAAVLFKHGFGDLLRRLGLHRMLRPRPWQAEQTEGGTVYIPTRSERVRMALEELGPAFVKFGQLLSTRVDIVPPPLLKELEKLQDAVPPFPTDQARAIVEAELGKPVNELFSRFEETPLASASIAQVHEAVTRSGARIVLKIRRPNIGTVVATDLEIMADLAELIEHLVPEAAVFEPVRLVREFSRNLRRELDLGNEAMYVERFSQNFRGDARIHVPAVHRGLSTAQVLALEFIDGIKISRLDELAAGGIDRNIMAVNGAQLMLEQVFIHGFFHGDPHPGNILVMRGNVLCYLDYGLMGMLTIRQRERLSDLIIGLVSRDERRIAQALVQLSGFRHSELLPNIEADVLAFAESYLRRPLREIEIGTVFREIASLVLHYRIHLPPEYFLLAKALAMTEGVGRRLSPDFDVMEAAAPFARKLLRDRLNPKRLAQRLAAAAAEAHSFLRTVPGEISDLLAQAKSGDFKINFEHRGMEKLAHALDQVSNRIAFAIVLASLIIGSAVIVHSKIPPAWHGLPVIGVIGFAVSGLMGFSLLYSIIKHGRM